MNPVVEDALIEHLLQFVTPEKRSRMESVLAQRTSHVQVVLEDIFQPHNASAVMRSCECFGIQHLHVIENRYPYSLNREVAMGASNWINLHRYREPGHGNSLACIRHLKSRGLRLVATCLSADDIPMEELPLDRPLALWFGTEEDGLSETVLEAADLKVRIPMYGFTQSFNLSVCAAICLHDIRRRLMESTVPWALSANEKRAVMRLWLGNAVRNAGIIERTFLLRHGTSADP